MRRSPPPRASPFFDGLLERALGRLSPQNRNASGAAVDAAAAEITAAIGDDDVQPIIEALLPPLTQAALAPARQTATVTPRQAFGTTAARPCT